MHHGLAVLIAEVIVFLVQQPRKSENGREGAAQVVGNNGEKFVLGKVGFLQLLFNQFLLCFGLFSRTDIARYRDYFSGCFTMAVILWLYHAFEPDQLTFMIFNAKSCQNWIGAFFKPFAKRGNIGQVLFVNKRSGL